VEVKPPIVPRVERLPDRVGAMRVEVIPYDVHLFVWVRACHALHEGHQIVLGAPLAAFCQHLSGMHV
jgi:hypothetical protein